jgi:ArsR family transcriptional regulator, arsenate/arsenite/antimonite-responsive transcriptional repressor
LLVAAVTRESRMQKDERTAAIARALSHPARVRIVRLLAAQPECRGVEVFSELPLAQSTISEHLRILIDAGLVRSRSVGRGVVYCLVSAVLDEFVAVLQQMADSAAECPPGSKES